MRRNVVYGRLVGVEDVARDLEEVSGRKSRKGINGGDNISMKYQSATLVNCTPSDGTPSAVYKRDGPNRGQGTKMKCNAASQRSLDERSEAMIQTIRHTVENTTSLMQEIVNSHRGMSSTERKYTSVQTFTLLCR